MAAEVDHYFEAHKAAEEHLAACWQWMEFMDGGEQLAEGEVAPPEPDQLGPFCGCETCEIREILHAAEPHLRRAWEAESRYPAAMAKHLGIDQPCNCPLGTVHTCGEYLNKP